MDVVLQLVKLLFGVGIVLSLVRALWPRGSASEAACARRRAEWLSVAFGLVMTYLVLVTLRALNQAGGVNPLGVLPFLTLSAVVPVAAVVLRAVWRRALSAAAAAGAAAAPPSSPDEPRRHSGLSGETPPPTRW